LTQIILARSLTHSGYGVFALLFGVMLLFFTCQGGLITYPLSLKGAAAEKIELRKLAFASLILTVLLAVPLSPIVFGAASVLRVATLSWAVILAMLLWQIQETFRRALMAHMRHRDAVWGDSLSYLGQAAVLGLLAHRGGMTLERAFLVLAVTSAAAALLQSAQLGLSLMPVRKIKSLAREYWSVGRWSLFTNVNGAASRQAFPWALALLYGPREAASFVAVMNVLGASHPVLFSTSNLIVPAAAGAHKKGGIRAAWDATAHYALMGSAFLMPYLLLLAIWPRVFLSLIYGRLSPYASFGAGLRLAALGYSFGYCATVVAAFLYGIGRSKLVFTASLGGTALALVPSVVLIAHYRLTGAIAGLVTLMAGELAVSSILAKRTLHKEGLWRATASLAPEAGPPSQGQESRIAVALVSEE
jgi:O-antigen/teichoic acid export membrane protein